MIAERRQFDPRRDPADEPAPTASSSPDDGPRQPGPEPGPRPEPADDPAAAELLETGTIESFPDQPLPGDAAAAGASARPGPRGGLARWWLHAVRGWPEALPFDRPLLDACFRDAARPGVEADLRARFRAQDDRLGRFPWAIAVLELIVDAPLLVLPFVAGLDWFLGWLAVVILFEWFASRVAFRQWFHPRMRALLRRRGVDCCLRCGHLIESREPAAACPECGQRHDRFPLRWAGGLAPP